MARNSGSVPYKRSSHALMRREHLHRRGVRLEWFTVSWNVIEAFVAIGARYKPPFDLELLHTILLW